MGLNLVKMREKIFLIFLFSLLIQCTCFADLSGSAQYSYNPYKSGRGKDLPLVIKKANDNLRMYEFTNDTIQKEKYLKEALRYYYICVKSDFSIIDCHTGLGKVYDEMGVDKYAKMEFNSAYNIDNKNANLNYRYGDFYYKRRQLSQAQHYFERAYKYGYAKNPDLNLKMSKAYIKLAQPQKAQEHLKIADELKKNQKTKIAVNNAIRQAGGVSVVPVNTAPKQKTQVDVKPVSQKTETDILPKISNSGVKQIPVSKTPQNSKTKTDKKTSGKQSKKIKFEEAVIKANSIKMIDDVDKLKPMYYLFIK